MLDRGRIARGVVLLVVAVISVCVWAVLPLPYFADRGIDESGATSGTDEGTNANATWTGELEKLARSLNREQLRYAGLEKDMMALSERIAQLESSLPAEATVEPHHMTEAGQELAAKTTARFDVMNSALQSESFDQDWATDAELDLIDVFRNAELAHLNPFDTVCRSSMCRVRFSIDWSDANRHELGALRALIPLLPWQAESWLTVEDELSGTGVLYLARPAHALAK